MLSVGLLHATLLFWQFPAKTKQMNNVIHNKTNRPLRETNTYLHSFGSAQGGSFSFIGVSWKSTVTWLQVFKATWPAAADIRAGWRLHHNLECRRCTALYHAPLHPWNNSVQTEHRTGYNNSRSKFSKLLGILNLRVMRKYRKAQLKLEIWTKTWIFSLAKNYKFIYNHVE